jgi:hypothetical protein
MVGAFVLPVENHHKNFWRLGAILPHSGNSCQVEILEPDPKPEQLYRNKKAHITVTLCGLLCVCVKLCQIKSILGPIGPV